MSRGNFRFAIYDLRFQIYELFFKVKGGEFAMILFGGFVVCFCGLDFVFEVAKADGFAVCCDLNVPSLFISVPGDAFVF